MQVNLNPYYIAKDNTRKRRVSDKQTQLNIVLSVLKVKMGFAEVYLINTLSPKYNKKDKRDDSFTSLKLDDLELVAI